MTEKPILFSGPMVRAILDGRKTQTRRVVKLPCGFKHEGSSARQYEDGWQFSAGRFNAWCEPVTCPYGQPGDRLLVKEAHRWLKPDRDGLIIRYEVDGTEWAWGFDELPDDIVAKARAYTRWGGLRQGRFLHNMFSRITLEVVSVRVERVQDISEADARAEGWPYVHDVGGGSIATAWFRGLWDSINAKHGYGWDANPWVWVVEFKVVTP